MKIEDMALHILKTVIVLVPAGVGGGIIRNNFLLGMSLFILAGIFFMLFKESQTEQEGER